MRSSQTPNPERMELELDEVAVEAGFGNAPLTPIPSTLSPWFSEDERSRSVICENDLDLSPRTLCRRILERLPMDFKSAFEYEFFIGNIDANTNSFSPAFKSPDIYSQHGLSMGNKILQFSKSVVEECENQNPPIKITTINLEYGQMRRSDMNSTSISFS